MLRSALSVFVFCALLGPAAVHADPASDRALRTANGLLERGLAAEAITEYRAALGGLDDSGDIDQALYGLAVAQFRVGAYGDSLESLGSISDMERFEFAADAELLGAHAMHRLGRYLRAAIGFESFIENHPRHGAMSRAAGLAVECAHRGGDHAAAIRLAEEYGSELEGTNAGRRILFFAAISYSAVHQYEEAAGF